MCSVCSTGRETWLLPCFTTSLKETQIFGGKKHATHGRVFWLFLSIVTLQVCVRDKRWDFFRPIFTLSICGFLWLRPIIFSCSNVACCSGCSASCCGNWRHWLNSPIWKWIRSKWPPICATGTDWLSRSTAPMNCKSNDSRNNSTLFWWNFLFQQIRRHGLLLGHERRWPAVPVSAARIPPRFLRSFESLRVKRQRALMKKSRLLLWWPPTDCFQPLGSHANQANPFKEKQN